jgi:hypothetical protein
MATTWAEIVTRAKARVDMSQSSFVEPDEWLEYARDSYRKLHSILSSSFQDYFNKPSDPLTVASDGTVDVPTDFQKLHAVDIKYGSEWIPLKGRTQAERSNGGRRSAFIRVFRSIGYRLMADKVYFYPAESASGQVVRLWYTPQPEKLPNTSGNVPRDMERWTEFLVLDMAIMAAIKEETDDSQLVRDREIIRAEIREQAMQRMLEDPGGVEDVRGDDLDGYGFYREEF